MVVTGGIVLKANSCQQFVANLSVCGLRRLRECLNPEGPSKGWGKLWRSKRVDEWTSDSTYLRVALSFAFNSDWIWRIFLCEVNHATGRLGFFKPLWTMIRWQGIRLDVTPTYPKGLPQPPRKGMGMMMTAQIQILVRMKSPFWSCVA